MAFVGEAAAMATLFKLLKGTYSYSRKRVL